MSIDFVTTREAVERIKDLISKEVTGPVFDHHVADALGIAYGSLRISIVKNRMPVKNIALFCFSRNIIINDVVF